VCSTKGGKRRRRGGQIRGLGRKSGVRVRQLGGEEKRKRGSNKEHVEEERRKRRSNKEHVE
jgi:hypothetical protein